MGSGELDDDSISDTEPAPPPHVRSSKLSLPSYDLGAVIGEGGMGVVVLAHDPSIGRDVAIKRMSQDEPTPGEVARFLREAKIQARLEHPAIVPVHEIGEDANGRPYFTMKRLAGMTLHEALWTPGANVKRMLRALVEVCNAVQLAHEHGVVHRDLKPSNIMLGPLGEVYVLDWGLARVLAESELATEGGVAPLLGGTGAGEALGTIGYMPPEQLRDASQAGAAADVYAIGAVLFEILSGGDPLHPRGVPAMASTLSGAIEAPSVRHPERAIPPELDAACLAALAADPAERPPARELGERIQRYLDGDRDLERRRALAAEYLAIARQAARDPARRAEAMRAAGRAAGLDPESDAVGFVTRLLLEPPPVDPPELVRELDELDLAFSVSSARGAAALMLVYFALAPIFVWSGIESWWWGGALTGFVAALAAWTYYQARTRRTHDVLSLFLASLVCVGLSRALGPYTLVPTVLAMAVMSLGQQPDLIKRSPALLVGVGALAFLAPVVLEAAGILPATTATGDDRIVLTSDVLHLGGLPTHAVLVAPNLCLIAAAGLYSRRLAIARRDAKRDLTRREWHLKKLLPAD